MRRRQHAAALVEFALAWPIALLLVLSTVEAAVWAAEAYAAHAATVAGARAGAIAGGTVPLVPGTGLPLRAHVVLAKEKFIR